MIIGIILEELDEEAYRIMKMGYRPKTVKNKLSQGNSYEKWCQQNNMKTFPADEWQLVRYGTHTAGHVTAQGTVVNYVSGVRSLQQLAGYPAPALSNKNLKLFLDGLKDELTVIPKQAAPMNTEMLKRMAVKVDLSDEYELVSLFATTLGFALFMRSSNLVPSSLTQFNPHEQFTRDHVILDEETPMLLMNIEWSKTDPHKEKDLWVPVAPAADASICPIRLAALVLKVINAEYNQSLFSFHNKAGQLKCLTYNMLRNQIKKWVREIGMDPNKYTPHSLRRGGASHAYDSGMTIDYIKRLGNWASDAYLDYIKVNAEHRVNAAVKFAAAMK